MDTSGLVRLVSLTHAKPIIRGRQPLQRVPHDFGMHKWVIFNLRLRVELKEKFIVVLFLCTFNSVINALNGQILTFARGCRPLARRLNVVLSPSLGPPFATFRSHPDAYAIGFGAIRPRD